MNLERVSLTVAKRLYSKGISIYVLPCKMRVENMWYKPYCLPKDQDFDKLINAYKYYNCNRELGDRCRYYKEYKEREEQ